MFFSYSHPGRQLGRARARPRRITLTPPSAGDLDAENVILGSVLYNYAVNNNIYSVGVWRSWMPTATTTTLATPSSATCRP